VSIEVCEVNPVSKRRKGRDVSGILLLDKPVGWTSNDALQKAKGIFGAAKAGHTGSLDPLASGLLPLCFGEATKFSQFLLEADKKYSVQAQLGVVTDSADSDGKVIETHAVPALTRQDVEAALERFKGEIEQIPPMYSALKQDGVPLYKLARQGVEVERKARRVTVFSIELRALTATTLELDIHCSKGTYVRTVVDDLGRVLGCGAHVSALRRTTIGPYLNDSMVTMEALQDVLQTNGHAAVDALLLPASSSVSQWPQLHLSESLAFYMRSGQAVRVPGAPHEGWVSISVGENEFIGVGEVLEDGRIAPRRLVSSA
jgi:tRNA pseudouridine55 synthase